MIILSISPALYRIHGSKPKDLNPMDSVHVSCLEHPGTGTNKGEQPLFDSDEGLHSTEGPCFCSKKSYVCIYIFFSPTKSYCVILYSIVCVCVCVALLYIKITMYLYIYICMCQINTFVYKCIHTRILYACIYIYIHIGVCVCVFVFECSCTWETDELVHVCKRARSDGFGNQRWLQATYFGGRSQCSCCSWWKDRFRTQSIVWRYEYVWSTTQQ